MISSAPMRELVARPSPASPIARPGSRPNSLKYRDFLTVMVILKDRHLFDDNWIYIHDPSVKSDASRIFVPGRRRWSRIRKACYGLEYFCFEGDGLWDLPMPN